MKWRWDYRDGYFACNKASQKLRVAALVRARILQFASARFEPKPLFFDRKLKPRRLKMKVTEVGRGIAIDPSEMKSLYNFDPSNPIQEQLMWVLSRVLDSCSSSALKAAALEVKMTGLKRLFPKAKGTELDRLLSASLGYLSYITEPYEKHWYIGIAGSRFLRSIIVRVRRFRRWQEYLRDGDIFFEGEIGETPKMRWVECIDTRHLRPGEAVMFGEDGLSMVETQIPQLRIQDEKIVWYGVLAFGGQNVLHIPEKKR